MAPTFDEVLSTVKDRRYYHAAAEEARRRFRDAGAEDTVICCGGFRITVQHYQGVLVSITPKARTAGRGQITIDATDGKPSDGDPIINGRRYFHDVYGSYRLQEALLIVQVAWQTSGGNIDRLYQAIGARGFCACCGAGLTDPLSIDRGIGPECIKKFHKREVIASLQARNMKAEARA